MKFVINSSDSINESLKKLNEGDTLYLNEGIYNEKVVILNNNINIQGAGKDKTIIRNHDWFTKIMPDYNECNTFRTYTLLAGGDDITISDLTIENTSVPSNKYGQAVALYAEGNNFKAFNLILKGAQDTLFTGPLPPDLIIRHQGFLPEFQLHGKKSHQIYDHCDIYGDVDFIFGSAQALFNECNLIAINKNVKSNPDGFYSAPSHQQDDNYGYLFYKCRLIKEGNVTNMYLSRPWRDYGTAAFIKCKMGSHINPEGFDKWNGSTRDKTARFYEYTENTDLSKRASFVHKLSKTDAEKYVQDFMNLVGFKKTE